MIGYFILGGIIFLGVFLLLYFTVKKIKGYLKKRYRPKKATSFKCLDGHVVRSKGELIIDNHLHRLGIEHVYEQTIRVRGRKLKYDWFLPEHEVYIEYWGYYGKNYMTRKEEKLELYEKGGHTLISIENVMFEDIYDQLERKLDEYINLEKQERKKLHCPNCGKALDKRFLT
ncbi:MAG: hypothetical protein ACOC35_10065 [Promethearchaeia archaeon]